MAGRRTSVPHWAAWAAAVLAAAVMLSVLIPEVGGNWVETLTITASVETGKLTTPSGLLCENGGHKERLLTWHGVNVAEGYHVYHSGPLSHGKFDIEGLVGAPSTRYEGLRPSYFHHSWYVTSLLKSMESEPSEIVKVRCAPDISFPGPKKPKGSNHHSQRTVELTWEPTAGAVLYGVARAETIDGEYQILNTTSATAYTDRSAEDGVTYYYRIVALDEDGNESEPSEVVEVSDALSTPTPTSLVADPDIEGQIATPTERSDLYVGLLDYLTDLPQEVLEGVPAVPATATTQAPTPTPTSGADEERDSAP